MFSSTNVELHEYKGPGNRRPHPEQPDITGSKKKEWLE